MSTPEQAVIIQEQTINDILIVAISGRINSANSSEFERLLFEKFDNAGANKLIFDFTKLDYISSAGLRVILLAGKKIRETKGYFALSGLSINVNEVFHMSGFDKIFNIYSDMQEAMQHAQPTAAD